ncbi:MAG: cobalamin-binding protein [Alphaproteobacteria bacterium]|nr:cobalamin-binding protein [Alphaproteobacteria bacterium]
MRVVSLTCSNTEIVAALGASDRLVAVDDHSDWPADVDRLPRVGPDLGIDLDAVEALAPDLVLASLTVPGHERIVEGLEARGLPFVAPEPTCLADVARDVRDIGRALGLAARGEALAAELDAAFAPVAPSADPARVVVEWWPKPVYVPGRQSWVTDLLALAGGVNPFGDREAKSFALAPEEACEAGIEAVVVSWCGVPASRYRTDVVRRRPGWEAVPAVRDGRIATIPECFLGRPGPRLVEGLAALKAVVADVMTARELR